MNMLLIGVRDSPERDISSLGTVAGWGVARLECPSAAAAPGLAWLGHFGKTKCCHVNDVLMTTDVIIIDICDNLKIEVK